MVNLNGGKAAFRETVFDGKTMLLSSFPLININISFLHMSQRVSLVFDSSYIQVMTP